MTNYLNKILAVMILAIIPQLVLALNDTYLGVELEGMEFVFSDSGEFLITFENDILDGGTYSIQGSTIYLTTTSGEQDVMYISSENPCLLLTEEIGRFMAQNCSSSATNSATVSNNGNNNDTNNTSSSSASTNSTNNNSSASSSTSNDSAAISVFDAATLNLSAPLVAVTDGQNILALEQVTLKLVNDNPITFQLTGYNQSVGFRSFTDNDTASAIYYENQGGAWLWFPVININNYGTIQTIRDVTLEYVNDPSGIYFSEQGQNTSSSSCAGKNFEDCMAGMGYSAPTYTDGFTASPVVYDN